MGKGDTRRPTQVDEETFAERWRRAFESAGIEQEEPPEDLFNPRRSPGTCCWPGCQVCGGRRGR